MIITLDGPAGVGKSSVSRALAEALKLNYIDTGAMYRGVAWAAREHGIDWKDEEGIAALLPTLNFSFQRVEGGSHLFLDDRDLEPLIRTPAISAGASAVGVLGAVREHLVMLQRVLGEQGDAILEGRDTGTVVFPQADHKFFLEASAEVRAQHRWAQLQEKGDSSTTVEELQAQIKVRDRQDSEREIAPLRCAEDAVRVDTSNRSFQNVVNSILSAVREKKS